MKSRKDRLKAMRSWARIGAAFGSISLCVFTAGCGSGAGTLPGAPDTLATARALWTRSHPASYRYQLRISAFAPPSVTQPVIVEVHNGVPFSITPVNPGEPIDATTMAKYDTVEELFSVIEDAVSRSAESLSASYDATYGFPKETWIDYSRSIADEELGFQVSNFTPLP
jgi:hypothetical protein